MSESPKNSDISNRALTVRLLLLVVIMFGFGFLVLPPLAERPVGLTG